jgi:hypothetical protein
MPKSSPLSRFVLRASAALGFLLAAGALSAPVAAQAAVSTFGSPLSVPSTLNTSENLNYTGTFTAVPPNPEAPTGMFHTTHDGADTALWNTTVAGGSAAAPEAGQALKVRLQGCAEQASNGTPPLTQIHFQDISPEPNGGVKVNLTSQPFEIPVCGVGGASAATVSTYEPTNLCVSKGDFVDFNDEGGYVPNTYRAGVPYEVIGAGRGSTMDSFIRGGGTNNGATFSPTDSNPQDGFATNANEELMLQVILGTGSDARYVCGGGTKEAPQVLPALRIRPQTDGVNHSRIVQIAVYCRPASGCAGTGTLGSTGKGPSYGHTTVALRGNTTSHVLVRISTKLMKIIRRWHKANVNFTISMGGQTFSQAITLRVY